MLAVLPHRGWIYRSCYRGSSFTILRVRRQFSTTQVEIEQKNSQAICTRNIGIIAHIDAVRAPDHEFAMSKMLTLNPGQDNDY
jgi:hypothetical protein